MEEFVFQILLLHFLYADTAELNFSLKVQLCYTVDFFFLKFSFAHSITRLMTVNIHLIQIF